ncbi:MAG: acetyl-CoA C-acetyltransferase [Firmicutes bacterium]|nr:acetyl-CoA C-acetyltransferase [Bacillota bacterium]
MVAIVSGARTPFGKLGGALSSASAVELGTAAVRAALARGDVAPEQVDGVVMGMVLQAGAGQIPSRQVSMAAGMPVGVVSETVNKVCASGLRAVFLADLLIRAGEARTMVAGGMESMSNAPYLVPRARFGYRMGDGELVDSMRYDGLWSTFDRCTMGAQGDRLAAEAGISRADQDRWALRSHERALAAIDRGRMAEEIAPVRVRGRSGEVEVAVDEAPRRDTSLEKLARLTPAFTPQGTITAGNAPGVNDGACALVLMDEAEARAQGREVLARIVGHGAVSDEPYRLGTVPALAARQALERAGRSVADLRRVEINEAFAAVTLQSMALLGVGEEVVNVNGGAIALGHPIGASGARILLTLIMELRRSGGGLGLAAICSGGGQGEALLVEV